MEESQAKSDHKNPVIKALVASYKRLVTAPILDEKRNKRKVYAGTNSRIRKSEVSSQAIDKD